MKWSASLTKMRDRLAELYETEEKARRVADDALRSTIGITFSRNSRNTWKNILEYAHKSNAIAQIIKIAETDFSENSGLINDLEGYLAAYSLEKISGVGSENLAGPIPDELRERIISISSIQDNLLEWKEIHNLLDELNSSIRELRSYLRGRDETELECRDLVTRYQVVENALGIIEVWSTETHLRAGTEIYGKILGFHRELQENVEAYKGLKPSGRFLRLGKEAIKEATGRLLEVLGKYEGQVSTQMSFADKKLRSEARKLSKVNRTG